MNWFADNIEGSLKHWFGSLTVVYDGDPLDAAAAAPAVASEKDGDNSSGSTSALGAADNQSQAQQGGAALDAGSVAGRAPCADSENMSMFAEADSDRCSIPASGVDASVTVDSDLSQQDNSQPQQSQEQQQQGPKHYMFGFQPHGLYPTGAGFLPWMPSFRKHFPDLSPVTLTATVIFFPPFIRDICCWAGFRQVCVHRVQSFSACVMGHLSSHGHRSKQANRLWATRVIKTLQGGSCMWLARSILLS